MSGGPWTHSALRLKFLSVTAELGRPGTHVCDESGVYSLWHGGEIASLSQPLNTFGEMTSKRDAASPSLSPEEHVQLFKAMEMIIIMCRWVQKFVPPLG